MLNISVAPTEYLTTDIASLVFISVQHFRDATMKKAGDEVGKSQLPQFLSSILHNTNYASFLYSKQLLSDFKYLKIIRFRRLLSRCIVHHAYAHAWRQSLPDDPVALALMPLHIAALESSA